MASAEDESLIHESKIYTETAKNQNERNEVEKRAVSRAHEKLLNLGVEDLLLYDDSVYQLCFACSSAEAMESLIKDLMKDSRIKLSGFMVIFSYQDQAQNNSGKNKNKRGNNTESKPASSMYKTVMERSICLIFIEVAQASIDIVYTAMENLNRSNLNLKVVMFNQRMNRMIPRTLEFSFRTSNHLDDIALYASMSFNAAKSFGVFLIEGANMENNHLNLSESSQVFKLATDFHARIAVAFKTGETKLTLDYHDVKTELAPFSNETIVSKILASTCILTLEDFLDVYGCYGLLRDSYLEGVWPKETAKLVSNKFL